MSSELTRLRAELSEIRERLIEAEADLADRRAEINAFELTFEARVGHLLDKLERLETEIQTYTDRIQMMRNKERFGQAHLPVERQYRRAWQRPPDSAPTPPEDPLPPADEAEIKRLYRRLARRFHPDLATNELDRQQRTHKMALVNDAYAARSLVELVALAEAAGDSLAPDPHEAKTKAQLIAALQAELKRCQARLRQIEKEQRQLGLRPSLEISLEVKAAQRQGRDLLAEIAAELEQKIARNQVERDMLKSQFDQLGPDQGFIRIDRGNR